MIRNKIAKNMILGIICASTFAFADDYEWTQVSYTDEAKIYAGVNASIVDVVGPDGGTRKIVKAWSKMVYKRVQSNKSKQLKGEWLIDCNKGLTALAQSISYDKSGKVISKAQNPNAIMSMESPAPESLSFHVMSYYCDEMNKNNQGKE